MKRALLIAGGTVGGLGAVLVITPPNLSKTTLIAIDTPVPAPSATPTVAPAKPVDGVTGSFTGSVANTRYGPVHEQRVCWNTTNNVCRVVQKTGL